MEATGRGHFVGVTMSVLQNQDGWWGEGDDMFFVDGEKLPSINGTGSEDYFLGAWDFGGHSFAYGLFGAPVVGQEVAGGRWMLYRFHLDSPITFTQIAEGDHRAWARQRSLRQPVLGGVLVPGRTARCIPGAAVFRSANSQNPRSRRPRQRGKVIGKGGRPRPRPRREAPSSDGQDLICCLASRLR